jgi:hypothetical protein
MLCVCGDGCFVCCVMMMLVVSNSCCCVFCMVVVGVVWIHSSSLGLSEWTSRSGHLPPGAWRRPEDQERCEYSSLWAGSDGGDGNSW